MQGDKFIKAGHYLGLFRVIRLEISYNKFRQEEAPAQENILVVISRSSNKKKVKTT